MSSTNKTPNYDLSQFIGTDKPTYLGDYNGDMLKIDTALKDNANASTEAKSSAGSALAKAEQNTSDLEEMETRLTEDEQQIDLNKANAELAGNTAETANNTANFASQTAQTAKNSIDSLLADLNWVFGNNIGNGSLSNLSNNNISCAYNPACHILNIFGELTFTAGTTISAGTALATIPSNVLQKIGFSNPRTIFNGCFIKYTTTDGVLTRPLALDSNGKLSRGGSENNITAISFNISLCTAAWD